MANPKKPAALKVIAGTDRPDRKGADPIDLPLVSEIPPAPEWLPNKHAEAEWNRLAAILHANGLLTEAGLATQAAVSPVLPSSYRFGELLSGATRSLCIDDYFMGDGSLGKRTAQLPVKDIYVRNGWDEWYSPDAYKRVHDRVRAYFEPGRIAISQAGFMPQPPQG